MKRSRVKRTPLSRARLAATAEAYATARVAVHARADGRCEICWSPLTLERMHAHHRLRRSSGRLDCPSNLLALCTWCHDEVHAHPAVSKELGRLISRHDPRTPDQIPVMIHAGRGVELCLLSVDGKRVPVAI